MSPSQGGRGRLASGTAGGPAHVVPWPCGKDGGYCSTKKSDTPMGRSRPGIGSNSCSNAPWASSVGSIGAGRDVGGHSQPLRVRSSRAASRIRRACRRDGCSRTYRRPCYGRPRQAPRTGWAARLRSRRA